MKGCLNEWFKNARGGLDWQADKLEGCLPHMSGLSTVHGLIPFRRATSCKLTLQGWIQYTHISSMMGQHVAESGVALLWGYEIRCTTKLKQRIIILKSQVLNEVLPKFHECVFPVQHVGQPSLRNKELGWDPAGHKEPWNEMFLSSGETDIKENLHTFPNLNVLSMNNGQCGCFDARLEPPSCQGHGSSARKDAIPLRSSDLLLIRHGNNVCFKTFFFFFCKTLSDISFGTNNTA